MVKKQMIVLNIVKNVIDVGRLQGKIIKKICYYIMITFQHTKDKEKYVLFV